jgi:uncharacterized membrane protein
MGNRISALALVAITIALVGVVDSAFAGVPNGTIRAVPGPIAGAGLPILAIGFGAYWLVKRFRRKQD